MMWMRSRSASVACLLIGLAWAGIAQAQETFLLSPNKSGAQWQIGTGLKLPIGPEGIFQGGMSPAGAGEVPILNVPPVPGATVMQTANGGLQVPAAAFSRPAAGTPRRVAVLPSNPAVFQVATSIDHQFPAVTATFAPQGAPGPATFLTPPDGTGGLIRYSGGEQAFGGPAQFRLGKGSGAGVNGVLSPNGAGEPPNATVWINFDEAVPGAETTQQVAVVGAGFPLGGATTLGAVGASLASPPVTTMWGPGTVRLVSVGDPICCQIGTLGTINSSVPVPGGAPFPSNQVFASKGFPWTTGLITISNMAAVPAEVFYLSGTDDRDAQGTGNVTLVSGALSDRALSGPNANRGWVRMLVPEPGAVLGTAGALGMLGLCHSLVRRRRAGQA